MSVSRKGLLGAGAAFVALTGLLVSTFGETQTQAIAKPINNQQASTLIAQNPTTLRLAFPNRGEITDAPHKANAVAAFLSKQQGRPVQAVVAEETAAVEALRAGRVDAAFVSSRPALKAEQLANARLYLAEVRPNYSGGHTYSSIFVVPKNSSLTSKDSAKATLEQLRGKRMAFVSPTSGSGFIFPVGELVKQGFVPNRDRLDGFFGQVSYGSNYSGALQAVLRGQADAAVVSEYALNPPYVTAEEKSQLRVLHAITGVPAHGIVIDDSVAAPMREKLIAALMQLNQSPNSQLLKDLSNATSLVKVNHDSHLAPIRDALQRVGIEP